MPQQNEQREEEKKKKRGLIAALILVLCAVAIATGVIFAFFSDVITGGGTATSGTLDIRGTIGINQSGISDPITDGVINNLNPGDTLTIDLSNIENIGTKSAWIREAVKFTAISSTNNLGGECSDGVSTTASACALAEEDWTPIDPNTLTGNLADWLWVCTGDVDQATLIAASRGTGGFAANKPTGCVKADTSTVLGKSTGFTVPEDVISGTIEDDGNGVTWSPATADQLTIYFDALAPNAAQHGNMKFDVLIQALQYRNNTTSPDATAWATVVTEPFGLL